MTNPKITVLMSVYNGEKHLHEAIDSILNQTCKDFEFLIINDGSTDRTAHILQNYNDPRIKIINNEENMGLVKSLNKGLSMARGEYIARMDADDISLPERIAKQVQYMDEHPEVGILGTWIECIAENVINQNRYFPSTPGFTGWTLFFDNCIAHPTVMMRRNVIESLGFYRSKFLHSEDYDLWTRANGVTQLTNLPHALLRYRISKDSICILHSQAQNENGIKIAHSMFTTWLGPEISIEEIVRIQQMTLGIPLASLEQIESVSRIIHKLHRVFLEKKTLESFEVEQISNDAAIKLKTLALWAKQYSLRKSLGLYLKALSLNPRIFIRDRFYFIKRTMKR